MRGVDSALVISVVALLLISRRSLLRLATHGFFRLHGFLAIVGMLWLTLPDWGRYSSGWTLAASSLSLWGALYLVIHAMFCLLIYGRPTPQRRDAANFAFENTGRLIDRGLYRYIRHPMYASLILLLWGIYFKAPQLVGSLLALAGTLLLVRAARVEERENLRTFGRAYHDYRRRTWMFAPFVLCRAASCPNSGRTMPARITAAPGKARRVGQVALWRRRSADNTPG